MLQYVTRPMKEITYNFQSETRNVVHELQPDRRNTNASKINQTLKFVTNSTFLIL